jgi:hypothetical protein
MGNASTGHVDTFDDNSRLINEELTGQPESRSIMQVEHEQRHRDGENPVAQGCKSLQTLARDTVVICSHSSFPRFQSNNVRSFGEKTHVS